MILKHILGTYCLTEPMLESFNSPCRELRCSVLELVSVRGIGQARASLVLLLTDLCHNISYLKVSGNKLNH